MNVIKLMLYCMLAVGCAGSGKALEEAPPVISIKQVLATPKTGWVEVAYSLAGPEESYGITMQVSEDNGETWEVPVLSVDGVEGRVAPADNLILRWQAGADWPDHVAPVARLRLRAESLPLPDGEFVPVPSGPFVMGDTLAEGSANERPAHPVWTSAFRLGKYEVTEALWSEVREWAIGRGYHDLPAGSTSGNGKNYGKGPAHPVHMVAWFDALKWCNARSEREGLTPCYRIDTEIYRSGQVLDVVCDWAADGFRLPTEAEWEKAARGGLHGKRFPWGDTIDHLQANYLSTPNFDFDVSPNRGFHLDWWLGDYPYTAVRGAFDANGLGFHDMAGNVSEWCWDRAGSHYYVSSPFADPRGMAGSGVNRVTRGGGWSTDAAMARVADRDFYDPGHRNMSLGFRLARRAEAVEVVAVSPSFVLDTRASELPTWYPDLKLTWLPENGRAVLSWNSEPGRHYQVEWSPDLKQWNIAIVGEPATPPRNVWTDERPHFSEGVFYRVTMLPNK